MLNLHKNQEKIVNHSDIQKVDMKEYNLISILEEKEKFNNGAVFVLQQFYENREYLNVYVTVNGMFTELQLGENLKQTWLYSQSYESYYNLSFNLNLANNKFYLIGFLPEDYVALELE